MELLVYVARCILTTLFAWLSVRVIGQRSIAQMTSYDFAAIMMIANVASEPLVYKIESKAFVGTLIIALMAVFIGWLSLRKFFYNLDAQPSILIANGKIIRDGLRKNRMNLPFLLSLLRLKGYAHISEVEFAVLEPNGNLSVLPKSQNRPVQPKDLNLNTEYEGLALPLIIDGEIQYNNLKYANLTVAWLYQEINKAGVQKPEAIFLAELRSTGELYVDAYQDKNIKIPELI
jgi:uncharacterized membrane protein YcaP (DUF421 family)